MALDEKSKKQLFGFIGVLGIGLAILFWYFWYSPKSTELSRMRVEIDSLQTKVDEARRDLAQGSVETLRQRVASYQGAVNLMRRLVPAAGEVANLIDDVSSRAKQRGVDLAQFTPLGVQDGSPFQTHSFRFAVMGRYDEIGEFLADIGSLPRIMVPYDVTVSLANEQARRVYSDTTGALLEVNFRLRTYVKAPPRPPRPAQRAAPSQQAAPADDEEADDE